MEPDSDAFFAEYQPRELRRVMKPLSLGFLVVAKKALVMGPYVAQPLDTESMPRANSKCFPAWDLALGLAQGRCSGNVL